MYMCNKPRKNNHKVDDAILTISISLRHVKQNFNT